MIESLTNYSVDSKGVVQNTVTGRVIKPHFTAGYPVVRIRDKAGKKTNYYVHRLVAQTYLPNPDNKPFVNHIDGDPSNCRVENLEWCTQKENIYHSKKITGHGAVISKKRLLELYQENPTLGVDEFLKLLLDNCN